MNMYVFWGGQLCGGGGWNPMCICIRSPGNNLGYCCVGNVHLFCFVLRQGLPDWPATYYEDRLASNPQRGTYACLQNADIKGVDHHAWL